MEDITDADKKTWERSLGRYQNAKPVSWSHTCHDLYLDRYVQKFQQGVYSLQA